MHLTSVRLENFQSHVDTTLELHPAFNCLTGIGNSGKTAIIRALSFAVFGEWDSSWVREGAKTCRITLQTSQGATIIREKGKGVNKYVLKLQNAPEQVFEGFGKDVPEPVSQALGMHKVQIGSDDDLNLNLSSQFDEFFLLTKPGSYKAKVFGKLSKAHYLDHALRELNKDKKRFATEKGLFEVQKADVENQLKHFAGLDAALALLTQVEALLVSLEDKEKKLQSLRSLSEKMSKWKEAHKKSQEAVSKLKAIQVPDLEKLENLTRKIQPLRTLEKRMILFKQNLASQKQRAVELERQRVNVIQQYVELLKQHSICPVCFGAVDTKATERVAMSLA